MIVEGLLNSPARIGVGCRTNNPQLELVAGRVRLDAQIIGLPRLQHAIDRRTMRFGLLMSPFVRVLPIAILNCLGGILAKLITTNLCRNLLVGNRQASGQQTRLGTGEFKLEPIIAQRQPDMPVVKVLDVIRCTDDLQRVLIGRMGQRDRLC